MFCLILIFMIWVFDLLIGCKNINNAWLFWTLKIKKIRLIWQKWSGQIN
jgi:hypothetical protein